MLTRFRCIPRTVSIFQITSWFTEIHIGFQQPNAEVTQTLGADRECQDAIKGKLRGCETRLLMALVSYQLLADPVEKNS